MTTPRHQPHPQARLGGLIVASIAAHWLVLAGWEQPAPVMPANATLAVALLPVEPTAAHKQIARAEQRNTRESQTPQPTPTAAPETPAPAAITTATAIATPAADQALATTVASPPVAWAEPGEAHITEAQSKPPAYAEEREKIRNRLNHDLSRHFKYPHLAQLRSWEGTVLLDLQIETDGRISRITLAQSSGYPLLDDNAIATLNRIGNVSGAEQWLEGSNMELQLPVIYRLSDS